MHQIVCEVCWQSYTILTSFNLPHSSSRDPRWVSWHPSEDGEAVLNVDGSCISGRAGFGGVLRRPNGSWILGFYGSLGEEEILFAELMALKHGLLVAWEEGIHDLTFTAI